MHFIAILISITPNLNTSKASQTSMYCKKIKAGQGKHSAVVVYR